MLMQIRKVVFLTPIFVGQMILTLAVPASAQANNGLIKGLIGGVVGAALCDELYQGNNSGNLAKTKLACGIVGASIGGLFSRRNVPRQDQIVAYESYPQVLQAPSVGDRVPWRGQNFEGYHEVVSTGYYSGYQSTQCRKIKTVVYESYSAYPGGSTRRTTTETTTVCYLESQWQPIDPGYYIPGGHNGGGGNNPFPSYPSSSGIVIMENYILQPFLSDFAYRPNAAYQTAVQLLNTLRATNTYLTNEQLGLVLSYINTIRVRSDVTRMLNERLVSIPY